VPAQGRGTAAGSRKCSRMSDCKNYLAKRLQEVFKGIILAIPKAANEKTPVSSSNMGFPDTPNSMFFVKVEKFNPENARIAQRKRRDNLLLPTQQKKFRRIERYA
jgi:hypothetical protein